MGSDFSQPEALVGLCTVDEAAKRLRRSRRQVQNYMRDGLLPRQVVEGRTYVKREDLEQLAIDLGSDMPALNSRSFFKLVSTVRKLEQDVALFKRMWDVQDSPLRPETDEEAMGLYAAAAKSVGRSTFALQEVETWEGFLSRMDEAFFDQVAKVTRVPRPWQPFYQLLQRHQEWAEKMLRDTNDIRYQGVLKKLERTRGRLRQTVFVWAETNRGVPEVLSRELDSPQEAVERSLRR